MKKFLIIFISLIIGFVCGVQLAIDNVELEVNAETETGLLIEVKILNQNFEYFCEK